MADETPSNAAPVEPAAAPEAVTPVVAPPRPTYHVSIWDEAGPAYVCLLCPPDAPHLTLEAVKEHIPLVHACDAMPTETIPLLLNLRAESDARVAAMATTPPPPPEESPDAGSTNIS